MFRKDPEIFQEWILQMNWRCCWSPEPVGLATLHVDMERPPNCYKKTISYVLSHQPVTVSTGLEIQDARRRYVDQWNRVTDQPRFVESSKAMVRRELQWCRTLTVLYDQCGRQRMSFSEVVSSIISWTQWKSIDHTASLEEECYLSL